MKTGHDLLYGMLFLLAACGQEVHEKFDSITTSIYTNSYDTNGRLSMVLIKEQSQFIYNLVYIPGPAIETVQKYTYLNNDVHKITETNNLFPNEITEIVAGKNFEKH